MKTFELKDDITYNDSWQMAFGNVVFTWQERQDLGIGDMTFKELFDMPTEERIKKYGK